MIELLKSGLILVGAIFMFLAALGLVRMPDLLTRMHATTKAATLGATLIMLAVALHFGEVAVVARAFGVILFIMMTAPVAAHVIGRAGYFVGARLWSGTVKDELRPNYDPLTHELKSGLETQENAKRHPRDTDPD
ncbi:MULTISPECIES: monovalent cation/H(+) antiporter subunit G [Halomonadaceae]|jgi:multicomponent Na+:H+ antiporter subunit G|uniref:Monovalent cation/H(+) antiporter subunit G n=1 Tax=Vreelandella janggokensis TaxID=370767 RepID=A0ABT4ISN6_9GAMM|nr:MULTISPECIES: monovalent cation/H(+) antiporter subunit G [Halomonas]MCW4148163.1 monovalent cation/H(+) antiporter subunit G [Halomonas sp. 18H]MCZ0926680.1 monovalent cation/H(+) antiporter subunit G [Halomonas janggokensis]MCZ0929218.1 monovalent cation/H(+) antiporter subunit G [Halomonas janggokensis]MDR5885368.1 monovalent cation/H(+) antiporter subunit G [Halomonas janggokensis]QPL44588.1 monovalent cation/H(+) antiporter subunit G [Halomonas sp. A40-4]